MKKRLYQILVVVCVLALLISGGYLVYKYMEGRAAARDYNSAAEIAGISGSALPSVSAAQPSNGGGAAQGDAEEDDPALAAWLDSMRQMDLSALRNVNNEVNGWISIPDSELNYPIMAHNDNSYYLNHTWLGVSNAAGAIFLDGRCAKDYSDFNTIIYGHRMHNNMMFGTLRFYEELEYWQEHPRVYIFEDGSVWRYDIFAAYETGVQSLTYSFGITEEADKQAFIDYALATSTLETDIVPTVEDKILTLSTCTRVGGPATRWVVQAVLREN